MPSESISRTASKSARGEIAVRPGGADAGRRGRPRPTPRRPLPPRSAAPEYRARFRGISDPFQFALADGADQRGAFDQLVARGGEDAAFGLRAHPVARAPDALQRHRDRARRADLEHQIHRADIDAEFERSRRDHRAQFAALQPRLGFQPQLRDRLPWCGSTAFSPSRSASACATRSESRRVLTKTSVVRCARISSATRS